MKTVEAPPASARTVNVRSLSVPAWSGAAPGVGRHGRLGGVGALADAAAHRLVGGPPKEVVFGRGLGAVAAEQPGAGHPVRVDITAAARAAAGHAPVFVRAAVTAASHVASASAFAARTVLAAADASAPGSRCRARAAGGTGRALAAALQLGAVLAALAATGAALAGLRAAVPTAATTGADEQRLAVAGADAVVFFEGIGVADMEAILNDPRWVEWRGGPAHEFSGVLGLAAKAAVDGGHADVVTGFRTEVIERAHDGRLILVGEGGCRLDPVDEVVVLTGFRPDLSFLGELRLGLDERLQAPVALAPLIDPNQHSCGTVYPHGYRELSHPEQGVYLVGMKSYGRAPTFLAMTGYEQVRSVAAAIAGDLEAADRVELTLPETGVCGGAGLFDAPDAAESDGGCCAPTPQLVQFGVPAAAKAAAAEEAPAGGCCGS
ncbi:flavoprotein [Streptomyces tendae]|uniref:flavoprotein n=1 Tax=Streptomyces tendae TaxID=1932 RepID=UPI003D66124D